MLFNNISSIYRGDVSFATVQLLQAGRPPVDASVRVPIAIGKDRIAIENATINTAASSLTFTGSLTNLQHPVAETHVIAHLSLAELSRATGAANGACEKGRPCFADADAVVHVDEQKLAISHTAITMGRSRLNASGNLDVVYVEGKLAMDEIGGIFRFNGDSIGDVQLEGRVKSESDRIDVESLRVDALGGRFMMDGSLAGYKKFQVHSTISGFELANLERRFLSAKPGYDGALSGIVDASGDLSRPGTSGISARAQLHIFPASHGLPLKGRVDGSYDGAANLVKIASASLSLPHSLLTLNGVLGTRLDADFTTTDTSDLYPALLMAMKEPPPQIPLTLNHGKVQLHARADGPLSSPSITAQVTADRFVWEKRAFDHLNADVQATQNGIAIQNGSLTRGTLQASFQGSAGLHNWTLANNQPLKASAALHNAEVPDLLALAGESTIPTTGQIEASIEAAGTVGNPVGTISVSAKNGSLYSETFQTVDIQAAMSDQLVRLTRADWVGPAGTIQATGTYTHSRDTLLAGDLHLHAVSSQVRLNSVANLSKQHAGMDGTAQLNLEAAASVRQEKGETEFALTSLRGDVGAADIRDQKKSYGNVTAHFDTSGSTVSYRADSNLSGSAIHVTGQTTLASEYPITADISVQNLALENLPFDLGIPAKGSVALTGHAQGTLQNPVATAEITFSNGELDGEPINKLQASARYTAQLAEVSSLQLTTPAGSATLNGSFAHPANQFTSGTIQLHLASGDLRLDKIRSLQNIKSGVGGSAKVTVDLAGDFKTSNGKPEVTPSKLDASAAVTGVTYSGHQVGNAKLAAKTSGGTIAFTLDSDLARAAIHAQGDVKLTPDYPLTAQFSARELRLSNLKPLLNMESIPPDFEILAEVEGSVSGSARNLDQLRGDIKIPRFEASSRPRGSAQPVSLALRNEGPVEVQLERSVLTVRSAHIVGPRGTDIAIGGTIGFTEKNPLNLTVKANANMALLEDIDKDYYSSGTISLDSSVRGSFSTPIANGSLQLKNASINVPGVSNGISNANGTISLSGSNATITNLTGESGGGKVTLSGFAQFTGGSFRYSLRANASRVRTRAQGVSILNNASLTMDGSSEHGLISGTITVLSVGINPQSDFGSILQSTTADRAASDQTSPFLANTRLDVRIRTASNVRFQSALAQDLKAEANLNLVGTLNNPGMTGRVVVTEGDLVFFGNQYTVNRGVISFYNPFKIQPQLNVSLETTVQSVDVVLTLTGPMENLKLSYRSDPPLQFEEIVALLAVGTTPTSDPTLVANEPAPPQQSAGQIGESAVVSQAIAAPISSRLQRVFGVTQLKIDPTFANGSSLPQSSLTLQQRVANNVTFTYSQDYAQANSELIRVEWTISPRYSAVATRDINGIFGVDFFYKRQFR
jgi:translocation and assembly module TamB